MIRKDTSSECKKNEPDCISKLLKTIEDFTSTFSTFKLDFPFRRQSYKRNSVLKRLN